MPDFMTKLEQGIMQHPAAKRVEYGPPPEPYYDPNDLCDIAASTFGVSREVAHATLEKPLDVTEVRAFFWHDKYKQMLYVNNYISNEIIELNEDDTCKVFVGIFTEAADWELEHGPPPRR